jgi:plastocyanin
MKLISITLFALYFSAGLADTYCHQPRCSNNRLNEKSANRQNGNRLFDSQNNNRGGYNVGEFGSQNGFENNQNSFATDELTFNYKNTDWAGNNDAGRKQTEEVFLENSIQSVTWTAQHGCGNAKNNCNMVFEYTCDTHPQDAEDILEEDYTAGANAAMPATSKYNADADWRAYKFMTGTRVRLSNGANTNTPNDPNNIRNVQATFQNNNNDNEGRHESEEYYIFAKNRERNKSLFTADQKLQGNDQTKTRQNPGGTRRGLEVPEERDYFPYWQPSIWRPVAIMHNDVAECQTQMAAKSAANEAKSACVPKKEDVDQQNGAKTNNELADLVSKTNEADCEAEGGEWFTEKFDMPAGYPFCVKTNWSQVNNLGNVKDTGNGGLPQNWDWTLPTIDQFAASGCYVYTAANTLGTGNNAGIGGQKYVRVVTRLRYNMTTMDYAPYATTAACNQNKKGNVQSPVEQNPTVDVGVDMQGLRLALNTAQTGRTFQDRSHVFRVMKTPDNGAQNAAMKSANKIINVSVQGKRGNIVQTFPAVEYDFWPKTVEMNVGDCAAFQWTGSNTHNNGNPAGDGQAGDAGEGRGGTDRSNLIQIMDKNSTYPAPLDKAVVEDFFANSKVFKTYTGEAVQTGNAQQNERDAQLYFMSAGYYASEDAVAKAIGDDDQGELNVLLNDTPASMRSMTVCPEKAGTYEFTCTRNNNFSNRDQKLTIIVK